MLDTDTKRRIDTARDILVGKVPDPKSQVEQITIALIYKFMDDMDAEAEELGGKRKFFAGNFARYGWAQLMRAGIGGHEMLGLYAEGITKILENPGIPPLFRDIFKNAYLPYRDPETLKAFLKIIDEFIYDHSERLGDAFEYLLSVLGSQGDAGQFRTPRHIIDFIVEILDPKKNESILDPACGTAGFLISAYKHILKTNSSTEAVGSSTIDETDKAALDSSRIPLSRGDLLTPDERGKLATNFKGYDISPDMVRLSLVNLYLHGFTDPHIYEYDTLTSEERWNEFADVILANPPFMSPKGGIKPHRRFSIQAKRSEVLFVDYMAEHLTPNGRAGIIVPEGIIFQSQTAYTELRRILVENSLVAVVSLPAGCFNPYSGVKTSILILDKSVAQRSDTIAFFKVENDGFGLGAQRRAVGGSDLPQIKAELAAYLGAIRSQQATTDVRPTRGLIVTKEKIRANGDFNLSGERYRESAERSTAFPWMSIDSLVETVTPPFKVQKTSFGATGRFPIIDQSQEAIAGWTDDESILVHPGKPLVIFGDHTCAIKLVETPFAQGADGIKILQTGEALDPRFLFHVLRARPLESDGYQRHYSKLKEYKIPVPPLDVQREIVAEIDGHQKVIDGALVVLDHYRPQLPVKPDWPMVELGDVCEIKSGGTPSRSEASYWHGSIPWVGSTVCKDGEVVSAEEFITEKGMNNSAAKLFPKDTTLIALVGATIGKTGLLKFESTTNQNIAGLYPKSLQALDPTYLFYAAQRLYPEFLRLGEGKFRMANLSFVRERRIPLPPLAVQQAIVADIEAEKVLVAANKTLIDRFKKKTLATLSRLWGEEEPARREA
ncbi:N-6 DNA methylase [Bradyrhizobium symbiodeficiens]|uniref:N-6 DNA methylase n=1 Tax=Bradyrhizobium symbiodeficiens TaxID=1404367 RepID=UPI000BA19367|nr:N-6 DNA methylase [Bradyrhizobium symbiodeficiens]AWM10687.1 N-6 DNA methylase [Bradyrhizobium symbiodeficiens]